MANIYKADIVDVNLETGNIFRSFLNRSIGFKDDDADRFGIRAFRDGVPQDLSGASCQAIFMAPSGTNIALTSYGTVSGNVAYVTLPPACYDVEGQFTLAIKLVGGGVTSTVRIVDGIVAQTGATGTVSPTSAVPTYQEILSVYDDMVAATSAANLAIAEEFDAAKYYPAWKTVINDGELYVLPKGHAADATWTNTAKVAYKLGDMLTETKNNIIAADTELDTTDFVYALGVSNALLQSDGTAAASSTYVTTDYIPLEEGEAYTIKVNKEGSETYTLYRCTYDSSKTLIAYTTIAAEHSRGYDVPEGVAYVRFSVSNAIYGYGFSFRKDANNITKLFGETGNNRKNVEYVMDTVDETDYVSKVGVVQKQRLQNDGTTAASSAFVTTDYIPLEEYEIYIIKANLSGNNTYSLYRCTYDKNKTFIAYNNIVAEPIRYYTPPTGVAFVRFSVSTTVYNSGFTFRKSVDDIEYIKGTVDPCPNMYGYTGNELPLKKSNTFSIYKSYPYFEQMERTGCSIQGFDIYDNKIFQFQAEDWCRVIDLQNRYKMLSEIETGTGHGNAASFSRTFYSDDDLYPLCYVSDIDGSVYVLRFANDLSECTLIDTLTFSPTTFGYVPQLAYDIETGKFYVIGNLTDTTTSAGVRISEINIADLSIVKTFDIALSETIVAIQGVKALNGHIFIVAGGHSATEDTIIHVISAENERITSVMDRFPPIVKMYELEDIAFTPNKWEPKYDMIMGVRTYGYWRLSI